MPLNARHAARSLIATVLLACVAQAHSGGAGYVSLSTQGEQWVATVDLGLAEVATDLALDRDGDGALRWGEVLDGAEALRTRLTRHLQISQGGKACGRTFTNNLELMRRATGTHVRIIEQYDCPDGVRSEVELDAVGWLRDAPDFGVYVTLAAAPHHVALLAGSAPSTTLAAEAALPPAREALRFVRLGFEHMATGYDHLAFLALLLLGALRSAGSRAGTEGHARLLVGDTAKLVTAFTAAHSLTLALAATGLLRLPSGPVEAAIALSIVLTALGLALGRHWSPGWRIAFGFGLVHGLGFAGLLGELLQGTELLVPLIAFNVGLELAQLALVAAALPALVWLARRPAWTPRLAAGLSLTLATLGTAWLTERL